MEFAIYVLTECECGQRYELELDTLPPSHTCGVCKRQVKVPSLELVQRRVAHWLGKSVSKSGAGKKLRPKGIRRV